MSAYNGGHPARPSSASQKPRFEFGSTVIRRPSHAVSLSLRSQVSAYPHCANEGNQRNPTPQPPRQSRPSSAYAPATRKQNRPTTDESEYRDRYLPRPFSAEPTSSMPVTFASHHYQPPSDESDDDPLDTNKVRRPRRGYVPPAIASNRGHFIPAHPGHPSLTHSHPSISSRITPLTEPREFMNTPVYFKFKSDQERQEAMEKAEREKAEQEALAGRKRRTNNPNGQFTPTIPMPARYAFTPTDVGSSYTSTGRHPSTITAPVLSTVRLHSSLGLHQRSLDVLQLLDQLKESLDTNFEAIRIEEMERRTREEKQRQEWIKHTSQQAHQAVQPMQYIQAGQLVIPNTSNVTSTTLALLTAAPASARGTEATIPQPPIHPPQQPTFLTDADMTAHALSNFTPAQRSKLFGGAYSSSTSDESKESPFNRSSPHDPDLPPPKSVRRVGGRSATPTADLPDELSYTFDMVGEFEESIRQWGQFLLQSQADTNGTPESQQREQEDIILLLLDISAKYSSLIRLAMNPNQLEKEIVLPRMMEQVWKIVMILFETTLVRKKRTQHEIDPLTTATHTPITNTTPSKEANAATHTDANNDQPSQALTITEATAPTLTQAVVVPAVPSVPTLSSAVALAAPNFDPASDVQRSLFHKTLLDYDRKLTDAIESDTHDDTICDTTRSVTKDLLAALHVQKQEDAFKESGMYSVGLLLQRDSLMKASEKLMRENEYLKLNLRDAHRQINYLKENEEIQIRALAQHGEDTVGIALDELDDWLEDAIDARKMQMQTIAKVSDLAYDWTNKHAASVTAEATAEQSHQESVDTIKRLNARESDLAATRRAELAARAAHDADVALEKSKAFAVLDREVRSLDQLTDDKIMEKVATITDVDTLRSMVHKLLYTKVKRHVNETPAQRAARLRKENTPKLLKTIIMRAATKNNADRLIGLKQVCRMIIEIYFSKITRDALDARDTSILDSSTRRVTTFHGFLFEFFFQKYGLKSMAEVNLAELLRSVMVFIKPDKPAYAKYASFVSMNTDAIMDKSSKPRLVFFARLLNLYTDHPIGVEGLEFFLYTLKVLQEACVQSLPSSFNTTHPKDSAGDSSRSMMRTLEMACVPINITTPVSARATAKKHAAMDPASLQIARSLSPSRGVSAPGSGGGVGVDDIDNGSLSLYVPLFLCIESLSHSFKHLGYTDDCMDATLVKIEQTYICPANIKSAGTDLSKTRILLKQIIVRQMIRTTGVATNLAFEKFDTDSSGLVTFEKLRSNIDMDKETANSLAAMMDPESGYLGPTGGITMGDFVQALSPDYRLCVSFDVLLELATLAFIRDHETVSGHYRTEFSRSDPTSHGLLNFVEFYLLLQRLDSTKSRSVASKLFREGWEIEQRNATQIAAAEEAAAKKKANKKKGLVILPRPPLVGIAAKPPTADTIEGADQPESDPPAPTNASDNATPNQVTPTTTTAPSSSSSSPSVAGSTRRVKFSDAQPDSVDPGKPSLGRQSSVNANEYLSLDTTVALLRRHRIGLPQRKPFHEFKAFFRRYRQTNQQEETKQEENQQTNTQPILVTEGITSIPE